MTHSKVCKERDDMQKIMQQLEEECDRYVCMCVCVYKYVCVCVCAESLNIGVCKFMFVCLYICMYVCTRSTERS